MANRGEFKDGCKFNPRGIICEKQNTCGSCGWNPEVAHYRKWKLRIQQEMGMPLHCTVK